MKHLIRFLALGMILVLNTFLFGQDIHVHYDKSADLAYYIHDVQPKETLYNIARRYGAKVHDIQEVNDITGVGIQVHQKLIVPFNNESLMYDSRGKNVNAIYYAVKKRETVFRICRRYFQLNMTAIKDLNNLERNALDLGQHLLLGYLPKIARNNYQSIDPVELPFVDLDEALIVEKQETREQIERPFDSEESSFEQDYNSDIHLYTLSEEKGAAFWDKNATGLKGHFVLHRYATRNSWIEVTNPMYGNSIRAKVIGNIPSIGYPNDVLVVVSPSIAKDLGALDARFYVKVRYLRAESKLTSGK